MSRSELLLKAEWSNKDIMEYFGYGSVKASKVHRTAVERFNGFCLLSPDKVYRDSVLKAEGVDLEREKEINKTTIELLEQELKIAKLRRELNDHKYGNPQL